MVLASSYGTPPDAGRLSMARVLAPLRGADLTFGNLEETLSQLPESKCGGSPNCFAFQAPPSYAKLMTAAGFDVMNVANNHADDFGPAGARSTERALRAAGLRWTGRPGQITILRRQSLRIAFLGFAPYRWAARLEQVRVAQALVRRAAAKADLVVVAMHAGAEGSAATHVPRGTETFLGENRGDSRRFAHAVVAAGADLVVGSGPHVIRGIERYHGRLIAYSLGNFVGYKNFGTGGTLSLSAILSVHLRGDGAFVGGTWTSLRLDGAALPHPDPSHASARLAAQLSREDFGAAAARIAADGAISCDVRSAPCRLTPSRRGRPSRNRASPSRARRPEQGRPGWKVHPAADGRGAPARIAHAPPAVLAGAGRAAGRQLLDRIDACRTSPRARTSPTRRSSCARCRAATSARSRSPTRRSRASSSSAVTVDKKRFTRFSTNQPALPTDNTLLGLLKSKGVEINANPPDSGRGLLASILLGFGPTLLILGIIIFAMRRATAGGGALGAFGRSKARRYEGTERVTFDDVAGIEEAEQELVEVVDFLKNPEKYSKLGGKIPRGVLLMGPPGTGKTLLARAVAGEAGVPFFSASASEFVEMIVGVGASRVRDLFAQAKAAAPAIVFIDELDAIGRARGGGEGLGGHDEREQTLNQILTEMDGFSPNSGVIVLAATNRPDVLDKALLRPGRFDRRVAVQPPDRQGRLEILKVHTRSVPLAPDVDLGSIASTTPGMVGADLANLVNEAALLAARRSHKSRRDGRLHRRRREDRARGGAARDDDAGRSRAHRLPRGRPRARRHAQPGRRSGPQGLHHPARHGARRDVLVSRLGSLQLRRGVPQGAPARCARRARGRGARLRQHQLGRGVRHPADDRDRAADGRDAGA